MGGSGSTRWQGHTPRTRVDDCRVLDVRDFTRAHAFQGRFVLGYTELPSRGNTRFPMPVHFVAEPLPNGNHLLTLTYFVLCNATWEPTVVPVLVQRTHPHFGGVRWWFTCPCSVDRVPCARRVRKLYIPQGGRYFGCRRCHDLTYTSVQEHDKRVDYWLKRPRELSEKMKSGSFDSAATKAWLKWFDRYLLSRLD